MMDVFICGIYDRAGLTPPVDDVVKQLQSDLEELAALRELYRCISLGNRKVEIEHRDGYEEEKYSICRYNRDEGGSNSTYRASTAKLAMQKSIEHGSFTDCLHLSK